MPIFNGVDNIANIYQGNNQILKVYQGANLKYELSLFGAYELIADINVATATTQIDFDNLNITKDDELRLVYTEIGSTSTSTNLTALYVNNNTTPTNYYWQQLGANGNPLVANRQNSNLLSIARSNQKVSGFADIKISNNDRFVYQSQLLRHLGSESSGVEQYNQNNVSTFTVSSITSLSVVCTNNQIAAGSRFTLYKVNKGSA